ncbi:hypothetical protein D6850_09205 [Roseovarius spongiae]|uniref:Uncharacterized protein n=1 Tax=Roseovarius spongiae TaxID=2320272 RepID=A0A3A8ATU2_9RHOB|nr:hypothetical protein [Roseovarius spongiae]RKF15024.1 hypothetical protein D6850_09205 [Roseovarius spongiae]
MNWGILLILALIATVVAALAMLGQRKSPGSRGSEPGKGVHVLESDYQSGVGGGHVTRWTVPRDPQEYAKHFVPKDERHD